MAETLTTLKTRRSCRAYKPDHVEQEKLDAILKAARENADKVSELEYITEDDIQQETERVHPESE